MATTAFSNWKCAVKGEEVKQFSTHGLLTIPMKGDTSFECNYQTSGLGTGAIISGFSLVAFISLGLLKNRKESQRAEGGSTRETSN